MSALSYSRWRDGRWVTAKTTASAATTARPNTGATPQRAAPVFGPVVSGLLLSLPITGSIMPPFTLANYGPASVARLVRGFVVGL